MRLTASLISAMMSSDGKQSLITHIEESRMSKKIMEVLIVGSESELDKIGELFSHRRDICCMVAWSPDRARKMIAQGYSATLDLIVMSCDLGALEEVGADLAKEFRAAGFAKPIVANSAHDATNELLVEVGCVTVGSDLRQGIVRLLGLE